MLRTHHACPPYPWVRTRLLSSYLYRLQAVFPMLPGKLAAPSCCRGPSGRCQQGVPAPPAVRPQRPSPSCLMPAGMPTPGTSLKVVDPASLAPLPDGQLGLLLARGPGVMQVRPLLCCQPGSAIHVCLASSRRVAAGSTSCNSSGAVADACCRRWAAGIPCQ